MSTNDKNSKQQEEKEMEVEISERYINPYTDFGFKKLFGTEQNKDLLISFLNALFHDKPEITDLTYMNTEHLGEGIVDRKAVFDVYCRLADGSRIIVEMQKAEQQYFKDRSIYYSTYPIREQAPKGKWDYRLEDVYTVGILNFTFPEGEYPSDSMIHEIKLKDVEDNHVFYDKLTFVYLEMPKFNKTEDELETMFDKWMFALSNLARLLERRARRNTGMPTALRAPLIIKDVLKDLLKVRQKVLLKERQKAGLKPRRRPDRRSSSQPVR